MTSGQENPDDFGSSPTGAAVARRFVVGAACSVRRGSAPRYRPVIMPTVCSNIREESNTSRHDVCDSRRESPQILAPDRA